MSHIRSIVLLGLLAVLCAAPTWAQEEVVSDTLDLAARQPFRLQPLVLPGSVEVLINGAALDTSRFSVDARRGRLWIRAPMAPRRDTVVARYRTFPFSLQDVYRRRSVVTADSASADTSGSLIVVEEVEEREAEVFDPFAGTTLQRSGSITRGVVAGNNRDATLESGLRMQLAGEVAEGVEVQAVLTDENTPIQPEGTTQRLDDFDRVFVEVRARPGYAQLGDFDLALDGGMFARLTRKLQGATLFGQVPQVGPVSAGAVQVAGAVSRGTFTRQDITPIDGVQGPYRLEGAPGESFALVVAGSETVYLDGQRLVRGETNDYVIDYATGEITFTTQRPITADRRIVAEYQYASTQLTRSLVASEADVGLWAREDASPRARFGVTFLREADARDLSGFDLSAADSLSLIGAGDERAFRSGAEVVAYDPEAPFVQYVRREVLGDTAFAALTTAPLPGETVYRVRFSRVGTGQGSYTREGRLVNGIAYRYVGERQGDYAPVRLLPMPGQRRLLDLRGGVEPVPGLEVFGEWAASLNDANRLSGLDSADDEGRAYLGGVRLDPLSLEVGGRDLGTLAGSIRRRFTGDNFAAFDRTRPVEFARTWNLALAPNPDDNVQEIDEVVDEADVAYAVEDLGLLRASVGRLEQEERFRSQRRAAELRLTPGEDRLLDYQVEYITSRDSVAAERGRWLRQRATASATFFEERLTPFVEVEQERRRQRPLEGDSLASGSLAFWEVRPGIRYAAPRWEAEAALERRTEELPAEGAFRQAAVGYLGTARLAAQPNETWRGEAEVGYRARTFTDYFRIEEQREDTRSLLLNLTGRGTPLERAVDIDLFYEAQTERRPILQEVFLRVGPELGQFIWVDRNDDGAVQPDEFEPEPTPNEGTYAQVFVPSDDLEAVVSVQTRARLSLEPQRLVAEGPQWWRRALRSVSTRTTFDVLERNRSGDLARLYLLDLSRFREPGVTLNGRLRLGQDLTLWRGAPDRSLTFSLSDLRALNELAAGTETRRVTALRADAQWQPVTAWTFSLRAARETNASDTDSEELAATRRYTIQTLRIEPEVAFAPSPSWRVLVGADLARKRDDVQDREARVVKLPVQVTFQRASRFTWQARAEAADVQTSGTGAEGGFALYELTDGRGLGRSYRWSLGGQVRLGRYLRATLAYDGRAPAEAPTVHTARVELSATF